MDKPTKVSIVKDDNGIEKMKATFTLENGKQKIVRFGASGMSDYTIHKDDERKQRYIARHQKRENWDSPMTRGALSRWILWNKPTLRESIADYKRKFNLG